MIQKHGWYIALILTVCMVGCGGSEYRFGNNRTLPNLSGQWSLTATSQATSQQFQGTANVAQTNLDCRGLSITSSITVLRQLHLAARFNQPSRLSRPRSPLTSSL